MAGSQRAFCSSVPSRRIVGATEVTDRFIAGAPAACISSMKMYCSTAAFPMPPNSFGQPTPHHPCSNSRRWNAFASGPSPSLPAWRSSARRASVTFASQNARTSSRQASCSGVKSYRMPCALSTRCAPDLQGNGISHCATRGLTIRSFGAAMSAFRSPVCLLVVLAALAAVGPRRVQADAPPAPELSATQQAIIDYVRDPNSNGRKLLDAARQETGEVSPIHEVLIGDAASRAGLYRTAATWYADARDRSVLPNVTGAAEFGLGWSALGRGALDEARDHLAAAAAADASLRSASDFGTALLAAAEGTADARGLSANVAATATDPTLREAIPLLNAYSLYCSGDLLGATAAFMSFAIANPDSRFTDDALYAAAVAKQQTGRTSEAREELEALAGDGHARGRVPTRLMELDPRAVLREGMRRDRERPFRFVPRRVTDLLDGDGVRLAQAALEDRGEEAQDPGPPAKHHHHAPRKQAAADATPSDAAATPRQTAPARRAETPDTPAPAPAHDHRFPWSTLVLVMLLAGVASYLLARRARQRTPGQRR